MSAVEKDDAVARLPELRQLHSFVSNSQFDIRKLVACVQFFSHEMLYWSRDGSLDVNGIK